MSSSSQVASHQILANLIEEMELEEKKLLEVGCEECSALLEMIEDRQISSHVLTTDSYAKARSLAKKTYNTDFVVCVYPYSIPWRKEAFDYIFCNLTLHNLHRQAKGATLLGLDYSLKVGGKIVVVEPESRGKDVKEIEQFLGSMGYFIQRRSQVVKFEEDKRRKKFYVLIGEKVEDRSFPIEKWVIKSYLKDKVIDPAVKLAKKLNLKIEDLLQEIKKEDEIDVESPLPPPFTPPSFEEIKERVKKEMKEKIESLDSIKEEITVAIKNRVENVFSDKPGCREPVKELFVVAIAKGCLDYESWLNIKRKYNLTNEDECVIYWRIQKMTSSYPIYLPRKGEKIDLTLKHIAAVLGRPFEDVVKKIGVYSIKDWEVEKKRLGEEEKRAQEIYEKELGEYRRRVEEWEKNQKLRI